MGNVTIHATVTLDGYMADTEGSLGWMADVETAEEDEAVVNRIVKDIGAIVGGVTKSQAVEDDGGPYGGTLEVPVFLLTHTAREPVEKHGTTYTFVVDDIQGAVGAAKQAAGDKNVILFGGSISRQCLTLGLVDEIQLHVVPILLGDGITLFGGLGQRIDLERLETSGYADETHMRFRVLAKGEK